MRKDGAPRQVCVCVCAKLVGRPRPQAKANLALGPLPVGATAQRCAGATSSQWAGTLTWRRQRASRAIPSASLAETPAPRLGRTFARPAAGLIDRAARRLVSRDSRAAFGWWLAAGGYWPADYQRARRDAAQLLRPSQMPGRGEWRAPTRHLSTGLGGPKISCLLLVKHICASLKHFGRSRAVPSGRRADRSAAPGCCRPAPPIDQSINLAAGRKWTEPSA